MDLRQLSPRNHINDWCTEYPDPKLYSSRYRRSTRHLVLRGDSGYFRNFLYDSFFIRHFGIMSLIYTLVNQSDKYNFEFFVCNLDFSNSKIPIIALFMPFISEKIHTDILYLHLEWLGFLLHINFKVYNRNFTSHCNYFKYHFVVINTSDIHKSLAYPWGKKPAFGYHAHAQICLPCWW